MPLSRRVHRDELRSSDLELADVIRRTTTIDFAAIAAGSGRLHEAARLLGAAKELRESIGIATGGFEAELEQATLSSLAATLGRMTLEQAFHEGELLTAEEAMTEALHVGSAPGVGIDAETQD